MTPLVTPVAPEQAPLLARPYFSGERTSPIVAALAHVPEALEVTMPFVATVLGPSAVDARTKELVILRSSARLGCEYCVLSHSVAALDSGVPADEVRALRAPGERWTSVFADPAERALLGWVDAVAGGAGGVPEDAGTSLRAHFSEPEVVELTLLCAATVMLNRFCTALALPTSVATHDRLAAEGLG